MLAQFTDTKRLLKKLTIGRLKNAAAVYGSYQLSRATKRPRIMGMPISVSIEPTTSCNLRCPECPSGLRAFSRPTGMLNPTFFKSLIDEINGHVSYLTFYFQGEPYLNPAFLEMVAYASSKNIFTATSTNAHFLNDEKARATVESGLDRLIISIDGTTQETYESYRVGGSLEKVIEGTRNIIDWKHRLKSASPQIIFQFLVVKPNEHQIKDVHNLASSVGVDKVVLKTAQIYDYENGSPLIPDDENYSRYAKQSDGSYKIKNGLLNECWRMWHSCVITWDGRVVPCCFDKDAHHVLGDLNKNSFREIWFGEKYKAFRSTLVKSRDQIDICKNCTEGTKVWA